MKKISLLPVLALVLALSLSAFTVVRKQAAKASTDPQLYWFTVDPVNEIPDSYDGNGLQEPADESNITGCDNMVSIHCRYGYAASQLNFDGNGNPVSVKEVSPGVPQAPAEVIRKHSN